MRKLYAFLLFFSFISSYSQLYKRAWGTLLPIQRIVNINDPFNPKDNDTIYPYHNNIVAHVDQKTNTLYHLKFGLTDIYKTNIYNPNSNFHYSIPTGLLGSLIESIQSTSKGDLIICGRTTVNGLATPGAYSSKPIFFLFSGSGFIAKVDSSGKLIWFTYFHALIQNASNLTIDNDDNIYIITNRDKAETLTPNTFQSNGDPLHPISYMNVISKLDTNGKHQWSTFYSKDQSTIKSIVAGTNGLYVYGEHLESTSSSNYFGSTGSFLEYATGMTTVGSNNANTVFLSKFNFNGTRAWSSYFGVDRSYATHNNILLNNSSLAVINDDAYILTNHDIRPSISKNLATNGAFSELPFSNSQINITLTKFSGNGQRDWTTFLPTGTVLQTNNNELFVSSLVKITDPLSSNLTTSNGYQKNHGGLDDPYIYIISNDGKKKTYASFYGFIGTDNGAALPTNKGYFYIGYTYNNSSSDATQTFATSNAPFKEYFSHTDKLRINVGNFLSYFTTESVSSEVFNQLNLNIYPNPTTDILNIQNEELFPDNTTATIYDLAGKRVLNTVLQNSNFNKINVSNLSSGVYFLQIENKNVNQSFKFIKK